MTIASSSMAPFIVENIARPYATAETAIECIQYVSLQQQKARKTQSKSLQRPKAG